MIRIRDFRWTDVIAIHRAYQGAFAGFPWYETLSDAEVQRRWESYMSKRGFRVLVAEWFGEVVGALLWDAPILDELRVERGEILARFAERHLGFKTLLIWEREVFVSPDAQRKGIGTELRRSFLDRMRETATTLILTRMRNDNLPIIHIARMFGFSPTGIKTPSSQAPGVSHEYWFMSQRWEGAWEGDPLASCAHY
jgi:L-amino acid N-acyltransferase YncA